MKLLRRIFGSLFNSQMVSRPVVRRTVRRNKFTSLESLEARCLLATFTVVNTDDSGPGSLRQAILTANALVGPDIIAFNIPIAGTKFVTAAGTDCDSTDNGIPDASPCWWQISLASALPPLTDNATEIRGTSQPGETNPGLVGTVSTVGVDAVALSQKQRPEVAIKGNNFDALTIDGNATGIVIGGLSIYDAANAVVVTTGATSHPVAAIGNMLVGVLPNGDKPADDQRNTKIGIEVDNLAQVLVTNCYVGFNGLGGIVGLRNESVLHLTFNEVFENGWDSADHGGIDVGGIDSDVQFNFSHDNTNSVGAPDQKSGHGIVLSSAFTASRDNILVQNNTVTGNISAGIAVRDGASGNTISKNVVTDNTVGILVNIEDAARTRDNVITQNSIFANIPVAGVGGLGIDLRVGTSGALSDGVTLNDPDDLDAGSNDLTNFPILTDAAITGANLTLKGFAQPGSMIEFFIPAPDPTGFGEGRTFVVSLTEGSVSDTDASDGTYGPSFNAASGTVNVSSAQVKTNRFSFTIPTPIGITHGSLLTATATVAQNTSEFGPVVRVRKPAALSGFVVSDNDDDGRRDAGENGIANVTITLTGTDAQGHSVTQTITTETDGSYAFPDLEPGTYAISETQPANFLDGFDTIGTQGGSVANDRLFDITLDPGEIGTENNFGELAPASLSGFVFEDSDNDGNRDGNEDGIKKVDIVLTGIDDRGSAVNRSATTNNSGEYTFDNLRPGVYQMNEVQPADFADGKDSLGTLGGTTQNDQFSNIVVFPGQHGAGYNFGELLKLPQLSDEHTFRIFPDTEQRIHIRLLSRPGFDPGDIDLDTVRLGNAPWRKFRRGSDLNGDGRRDVSLFFKANETGLVAGDKTVRLIGQFRNGGFFAADLDVETLKFTDVPIRRHPPRAN